MKEALKFGVKFNQNLLDTLAAKKDLDKVIANQAATIEELLIENAELKEGQYQQPMVEGDDELSMSGGEAPLEAGSSIM